MLTPDEIVAKAEASGATGLLGRHRSWPRVPVSELARIQNGAAFKSSSFNTVGDGLPLIRIRDVGANAPSTFYSGEFDPEYIVAAGDLLVGMDGDFRAEPWQGEKGLLNQRVCRLVVTSEYLDPRWLRHVIQGYLDAIWEETSSVTVKHLSSRTIGQIAIPLPPLPEQHRIVETLEDHLSRLEAAEQSLATATQRLSPLRKSVIQIVLDQELDVEEGTSAAVRLERILADRVALASKRRAKPINPAYELDLPAGWVTASVDQLCWDIQYGTSSKTGELRDGPDVPVLRMGNIRDGDIDPGNLKYLPKDDPSIDGLLLEAGDLLFNRTNSAELVGKTAVFNDQLEQATFASYLIRCRPVPGVNAQWISHIANSPIGRRYITSVMSQQVGQANVNGTKLAAMPIPIAPQDVEAKILDEISEARSSSARLGDSVEAAKARSAALRRSLLRAAFNGELVDQDPTDEPVDVALVKISDQQSGTVQRRKRKVLAAK